MFGIGGFELFIILLFGFLVFGPDKLPEMARTLGAALRKFKQAQAEMEAVIKDEVLDLNDTKGKSAAGARAKSAPAASTESFAERKARYDRQRREREQQKLAELEANRRAMKEEAAQSAAQAQGGASADAESATASDSEAVKAATGLTPDELFGVKPVKPSRVASAATAGGEPEAAKPAAADAKGGE